MRPLDCKDCELCNSRTQVVSSILIENSKLMIIGEAPGEEEDKKGYPFVGASGKLLDDVLREVNLDRNTISISNTVSCKPLENKTPKPKEVEACFKYLDKEIYFVKPEVIILLGNVPLKQFFKGVGGITRVRGKWFDHPDYNCKFLPAFHPAYILRNPQHRKKLIQDFTQVKDFLNGKFADVKELENDYKVIKNKTQFDWLINKLHTEDLWAFDTETTGFDSKKDSIFIFSFSWAETTAALLDLRLYSDFKDYVWEKLKEVFENSSKKIAQNGSFDIEFLITKGIKINNYYCDTILMHQLLDENSNHGLEILAEEYTNMRGYDQPLQQYKLQNKIENYSDIPPELIYPYANADADVTLRCYNAMIPKIYEENLDFVLFNIMMPMQKILIQTEYCGVSIDVPYLNKVITKYEKEIEAALKLSLQAPQVKAYTKEKQQELVQQLYAHWETSKTLVKRYPDFEDYKAKQKPGKLQFSFNVNSSKQLKELLIENMKLPILKTTDKGNPSLDDEVLQQYAVKNKFCQYLGKYRSLSHLKSTFLDGIKSRLENGKVHTDYLLFSTVCVTKDTWISTKGGLLRADEIIDSDYINGVTEKNIYIYTEKGLKKTSHLWKVQNKEVLKITLPYGLFIKCTREHPLKTLRGWVRAEDLQESDFVLTTIGKGFFGKNKVKLLKKFYPKGPNSKEYTTPKFLTADLAKFIGYYIADGSIRFTAGTGALQISSSKTEVIEDIKRLFYKLFNLKARVDFSNNTISVSSIGLSKWFVKLVEYERPGAFFKKIPLVIRKGNRECIIAFLNGLTRDSVIGMYRAGSGRKYRHPMIRFNTQSSQVAEVLQHFLFNLGVKAQKAIIKNPERKRHTKVWHDVPCYYLIGVYGNDALELSKLLDPPLHADKERIKEFKMQRKVSRHKFFRKTDKGFWVKVNKIESFGKEIVYDFTVPETNSYVANSLIVHNTGRPSSRNPNLNNIPRESTAEGIKDIFCSDRYEDGSSDWLVEADFGQAEFRCIQENQRVLMSNFTYKEIKDIKVGDKILALDEKISKYNKRRKIRVSEVLKVHNNGKKECIKIFSEKNSIICTPDHKFLRYYPRKASSYGRWRPLVSGNMCYAVNAPPIKNIEDYLKGTIFGLYLTDGSVSNDKYINICQSDEKVIDWLILFFKKYNFECTKTKDNYSYYVFIRRKDQINRFLKEFQNYESIDWKKGFISGVIIGDGWFGGINKLYPQFDIGIGLSITHPEVVDKVYSVLNNLSVLFNFSFNVYNTPYKSDKEYKAFFTFSLPSKTSFLFPIIIPCNKGEKFYESFAKFTTLQNVDRVEVSIEKLDNVFSTYDLTTTTGTFICEGFFVHNCWINYSQDPQALSDLNAGLDIHKLVAASAYHGIMLPPGDISYDQYLEITKDVTKDERQDTKFVEFGAMYGRGPKSISEQLGVSINQAQRILNTFFGRYKVAKKWLDVTVALAKRDKYVTSIFGRKRRLINIDHPNDGIRAEAERQAKNSPIQNAASDLTFLACIKFYKKDLRPNNLRSRLILTVYDSLVFNVPDNELEFVVKSLYNKMKEAPIPEITVPLISDIKIGKNWGSAIEVNLKDDWSIIKNILNKKFKNYNGL